MKIPLSWLKDYLDLNDSPNAIAKTLTMLGLEVDHVHYSSPGFSNVVVGYVEATEKHPNADSLTIATVSDGTETFQVVCGAPNCRPGIKTAFAKIGAEIEDEKGTFKIKKSQLRGVDSYGMLCSAKELQIGSEDEGIMEFASHLKTGEDVAALYGDVIFEIGLTPNLGHCNSIIGVVRELSAALGLPIKNSPSYPALPNNSIYQVIIEDPKLSPRYACCLIDNIKVEPSPEWMQKRLINSGLRPVNNIVDITNYVLLETGQPLHAFDADKLQGTQINVKPAKGQETFKALDEQTYTLEKGDILICDQERIIALGGVMGGDESKVTDNTTKILLESASFHPLAIRRTSRRLNLLSDAARRFEKGTDQDNTISAIQRTIELLAEIGSSATPVSFTDSYPGKAQRSPIHCRLSRIHSLLGIAIGRAEIESILSHLGFACRFEQANETFIVTIPSWRNDIKEEVDIIEEVARLYGYDNIPRQVSKATASALPDTPVYTFANVIKDSLLREGLQECITCDLISPNMIAHSVDKTTPPESIISVLNPCSIEQSVLRPSLMPGLLNVIKNNIDHQTLNVQAFEIGQIHYKTGDSYIDQPAVGIVLTGMRSPYNWDSKEQEVDFYDLKGTVENLLSSLRIDTTLKPGTLSTLHPGRQASVMIGECEIGAFGEVHPSVLQYFGINQRVYFAEFNLNLLMQNLPAPPRFVPLPIYPGSELDWTLTIDEAVSYGDLLHAAKSMPSRLIESIDFRGIFRSDKLPPNKKNATLRIRYRDLKKTISQQTVEAEHERLKNYILSKIQ